MQSFPEYVPVNPRNDEPSSQRDVLLGTVLAGRYRIVELVGSGGMGAVYRAEHVHMRKAVAVKVLHKEMTAFPEVVARFEREAVAAGRIEHPNVVSASDFGQLEDGSFYLVLEFIEGQSLAKLVQKNGPLPTERALGITRQIALALNAAHGVGIVHRDLKPDNVMLVAKEGEADFVKVLDFGIAKVKVEETTEQPALTQIGTVFGTPEYMSPEQARGELVDARADLYTVGVILYEMLSGVSPFKDDDLVVVLTRHLTADPPPLPAHVERPIVDLVLRLLRKNREERFQTAQELLDQIELLLSSRSAPFVEGPGSGARVRVGAVSNPELSSDSAADRSGGFAPTVVGQITPQALAQSQRGESLLSRPLLLGRWRVPLWLFATGVVATVFGVALVVIGLSFLFGGKKEATSVKDDASKIAVAKDSELAQLMLRAESGNPAALAELAARPEAKRALAEWIALGRGYAHDRKPALALAVYERGVVVKPELARDARVLADVHRAALEPDTSEAALNFAAKSLGAPGVDLIYDLWESTKGVAARAALTKQARSLLDDDAVRAKASPALKLLLEVNKAQKEGCASVKRWLARASAEGDARVLPALKRFEDRRGCGFLGLSDCYYCLRAGKDLGTTAGNAGARAAPTFD